MARCSGTSSERGQELVEFALLLPLLLLLLFGIIEFGIAVLAYNTISNVGREVARYGVVNPTQNDINTYIDRTVGADPGVERWTTGIDPDALTIVHTITPPEPGPFRTLIVTVTYEHRFLTGPVILAVGGNPELTMQTVTTMYTER
jgi:hypothetical protein